MNDAELQTLIEEHYRAEAQTPDQRRRGQPAQARRASRHMDEQQTERWAQIGATSAASR